MLIETAAHAAVFETVELARPGVRSLINAILRRALREKDALTKAADNQPLPIRFSTPEFLIEKWSRQFDAAEVVKLCQWNNQPAPVYARINQLKTTVPEFLLRYPGSALLPEQLTNFVTLREPGAALESGRLLHSGSEHRARLRNVAARPGETVLDACAAPGGKAAYLAEIMQNQGILVAADQDETRLRRLRDNFVRLGITNARTVRCDWSDEKSIRAADLASSFLRQDSARRALHEYGRDAAASRCPLAFAAG